MTAREKNTDNSFGPLEIIFVFSRRRMNLDANVLFLSSLGFWL